MSKIKSCKLNSGCEVKYWEGQLPCPGELGLYKGKIYRIVASEGLGKNYKLALEWNDEKEIYRPWKNPIKLHTVIGYFAEEWEAKISGSNKNTFNQSVKDMIKKYAASVEEKVLLERFLLSYGAAQKIKKL